jgi:hypothetical protein
MGVEVKVGRMVGITSTVGVTAITSSLSKGEARVQAKLNTRAKKMTLIRVLSRLCLNKGDVL